ncbi:hypothetical protein BDQ12DRAFT_696547 [Crucibulum laeve]|uniref:Uncharacterized protein n=1 Tax=Crucibulum laeve TaxID=68775 RepID=A0A5C3MC81_9AGAR|nr:hypothetical protein BDQ12DRAFT_696547 [Crucibulum laeve]
MSLQNSVFRVSPWVAVANPLPPSHPFRPIDEDYDMDDDVNMDAPQISTLREEVSPPPQRKNATARKIKAASKAKLKAPEPWPVRNEPRPDAASEEDFDEPEEEEDQLIDDDDDDIPKPTPPALPPSDAAKPKPITGKRKSRKSETGAEKEKEKVKKPRKSKVSQPLTGAPNLAPTISWFSATPSGSHKDSGPQIDAAGHLSQVAGEPAESISAPVTVSKRGRKPKSVVPVSPHKPATAPKVKQSKPVAKPKAIVPPLIIADDAAILSEGYTGTAPSSPVSQHLDMSPEPEGAAADTGDGSHIPLAESLENVPIPIYPLPSKPFPVQPPPKIASGFAPPLPLDRQGKKVRHWRTANREIRGIAGGRWFTRTWVGDKESEYSADIAATAAARAAAEEKAAASGITLPKLPSISAPVGTGRGRGRGSKAASSLAASAAPSRSGSTGPDISTPTSITGIPITSKVHVPTKMRVLLAPESPDATVDADAEMAPPSEA